MTAEVSTRRTDPIHKILLAKPRTILVNGKPKEITERYRFVVDVGKKANGNRDQRTFTFDSYKEAKNERARIISETATGVYVRPNRGLTVRDYFINDWLPTKSGRKPSTQRCYLDALPQFLAEYGELPLQKLDVPHLESLKRRMLSGELRRTGHAGDPLSARSVNLTLTVVSMALKVALRRGLVVRNVGELVERVESDPDAGEERGDWQAGDAQIFLRSVRDHRLFAAFVMSALGLRRGEVCGLRWEHADLTGRLAESRGFSKGTPTIAIVNNRVAVAGDIFEGTPKGKGRRRMPYLPIPAILVDALTALQLRQREEADAAGEAYGVCPQCGGAHIVVNELGKPYRPEWYSDQFKRLVNAAGVPPVVLHGARHSAASILADLGVPDIAAAAWLGQMDVATTKGYQHPMRQRLQEASEALGGILAA
jgi:integrase